jgi:ribosomal protein S18 acetylase RimI-like enzyme
MPDLEFRRVRSDSPARLREDWREIHNLIIPAHPLSSADVEERAGRNHLEVAYLDGVAIGCSTVRPPDEGTVTVIARVRPEQRLRGHGEQIYRRGLRTARELGAHAVVTVVLASNEDGLAFARKRGFVEEDRYVQPGQTVAFVNLRLAEA